MIKYFISRALFLFYIGFFIVWGFNAVTTEQLNIFFKIEIWAIFKVLICLLIILTGLIFLNFIYSLMYRKEYELNKNAIILINNDEETLPLKYIFFAIYYEKQREKHLTFLILLSLSVIYQISFKSTPFVYKYCAFFGVLEGGELLSTAIQESIVPRNKMIQTQNKINHLMPDREDFLKQNNYVFFESALIDGFRTNKIKGGLISYIQCIPFYAFEKLIRVFLFFLLPFIIGVIILELRNEKKGYNEQIRNLYKKEISRINKELLTTLKIIKQYNLDNLSNIQNIIFYYEKERFSKLENRTINNKNWFDAHYLLFSLNGISLIIPFAFKEMNNKIYSHVKTNFYNFHFSKNNEKNTIEKVNELLTIYEKNKEKDFLSNYEHLGPLLDLIPEIEIKKEDFRQLEILNNNNDKLYSLEDMFRLFKKS